MVSVTKSVIFPVTTIAPPIREPYAASLLHRLSATDSLAL